MPYRSKYHLGTQHASALLGPVVDTLRELERRTGHHVERLDLTPANRAAILAAQDAIARARAEIDTIRAAFSATRDADV